MWLVSTGSFLTRFAGNFFNVPFHSQSLLHIYSSWEFRLILLNPLNGFWFWKVHWNFSVPSRLLMIHIVIRLSCFRRLTRYLKIFLEDVSNELVLFSSLTAKKSTLMMWKKIHEYLRLRVNTSRNVCMHTYFGFHSLN